ncbi:hypothetical protein COM24_07755 [Bacillus toyonensis]|uniref:hypothetical protein n=1 Tax=Bacillus toyonensis TaxID=155322 RepID=UPI000BF5BA6C|nr:hypothetical protein [Bacillus toyonensis]PGC56698.1 hypothetical protein COM24_07755 [Bacillus toyonensis]
MATVEQQRTFKSYEQRQEMRSNYEKDRMKEVSVRANKRDIYGKENMLDLPRHRIYGKCRYFEECPIDYKCRSYDSSHVKCQNCELVKTDSVCMKKHIHNPPIFEKMIARETIDADESKEKLSALCKRQVI